MGHLAAMTLRFELEYRSEARRFEADASEGVYVGSGVGTAKGPLDGSLQWSLYEKFGNGYCAMYLVGELNRSGDAIRFEGRGFALKISGRDVWTVRGCFKFDVPLLHEDRIALWSGTFDERTRRAEYDLQIPTDVHCGSVSL